MNKLQYSLLTGLALGVLIAIVGTPLLGYTNAISTPKLLWSWSTNPTIMLITWDLLVVQLLGIGILATLATYLLVQYATASWLGLCSSIAFGELIYMWLIAPLMTSQTIIFTQLMWWQHSHTAVILLSVFAAGYLAQRKKTLHIAQEL